MKWAFMAKECISGLGHTVQLLPHTRAGESSPTACETLGNDLAANEGVNEGERRCFSIGPDQVTRKQAPSTGTLSSKYLGN